MLAVAAEVEKQFDKLLAVFQKEMTGEIMRVLYEKYRSVPSKTTIEGVMVPPHTCVALEAHNLRDAT